MRYSESMILVSLEDYEKYQKVFQKLREEGKKVIKTFKARPYKTRKFIFWEKETNLWDYFNSKSDWIGAQLYLYEAKYITEMQKFAVESIHRNPPVDYISHGLEINLTQSDYERMVKHLSFCEELGMN